MLYFFYDIWFVNPTTGEMDDITIAAHKESDARESFKIMFPDATIDHIDTEA